MARFNRLFVVLVVLAAASVSLACSLSGLLPGAAAATTAPTEAVLIQPAGTAGPTQPAAKATAPVKTMIAVATSQAASSGAPAIADIQAGLDKLDSYKMNYVMTIDGVDQNNQPAQQDINLIQEVVKSKDSTHLLMQGSGIASDVLGTGGIEVFQIGKTSYMVMAGKDASASSCISFSSDKPTIDTSLLMTPEEMVGSLQAQNLVMHGETVNGVKTDHYKVQKSDLSFGAISAETGDMWVSQDGGYLVRYTGSADGDFNLTTHETKGKATFTYNLTLINALKEIALPDSCQQANAAIQDLPVPDNATDQGTFGEIITYSSPDAPKVVADFYRNGLPARGWKITADTDLSAVVMISIQKDTRKFQIMLSTGSNDKGTSVVISKLP